MKTPAAVTTLDVAAKTTSRRYLLAQGDRNVMYDSATELMEVAKQVQRDHTVDGQWPRDEHSQEMLRYSMRLHSLANALLHVAIKRA